jgi:hypothetical protein
MKKNKKKEEVLNIENNEEDSASEEIRHDSPLGGGGDEVNQEQGGEEEEKKEKGEVTLPKDPLTEAKTSNKRNFSPYKPSGRKKIRANKPQSKNVLIVDNVNLIIAAI